MREYHFVSKKIESSRTQRKTANF